MTEIAEEQLSDSAIENKAPVKKGYRTYVLIILTLVYAFNFIDRQIIGILSPLIQAELGLDDAQMGFLKGLAFALFYTVMGIPIAWLADRYNRVSIIAVSLTLWSLFTALSGKAMSYTQLALARIGVGVGEAGGSPPSHSIISDLYEPTERARALAVYSLGIPIGIMIAYFATAGIIAKASAGEAAPWRLVLFAVGLPGILLAILLKLSVREPIRTQSAPTKQSDSRLSKLLSTYLAFAFFIAVLTGLVAIILAYQPITEKMVAIPIENIEPISLANLLLWGGLICLVLTLFWMIFVKNVSPAIKTLLTIPSWWAMCGGIAFASVAGYALSNWLIDFIFRAFPTTILGGPVAFLPANPLVRLLVVLGVINGLLYTTGVWLGGAVSDKWGQKYKGAYAMFPALALIVGTPFLYAAFHVGNLWVLLGCLSVYLFLSGSYLGPAFAIAQTLAPIRVRATSTALFFFILNIIALGGGPTYVGILSNNLTAELGATESLRYAMSTLVVPLGISILCFFIAAWRLPKDWIAAQARNETS